MFVLYICKKALFILYGEAAGKYVCVKKKKKEELRK
jgi:hypothetical protein